ncbi:glycosyltransferase [Dactylosporangium matsuzakiense]|uniref:Glycosyl transferase n=1 Tax=Dactylosporangium matsuzakiense TaxID=53360 RepID=A0A9W6KSM7_9ACTN|nr:nucleotide disphospho-sugar-binding domain-containing protein [Dactylosporangium matsuzakiense]UWZ41310.1 hypothetical protein Dmats_26935 [Dactylosporangium matsuzakiense]GLL05690.1 glycosyl transferase [Dactylosporangium matsuzakiense]
MATFLISTMDATGHVTPARAVAKSLTDRGHTVLWHGFEPYRDVIESTGARFIAATRTPSFADLPAEPEPGTRGLAAAVSALRRLMVDRMEGQLADYTAIAADTPVDAVLVDLCCLGGRAFHERTGLPWATLGISPLSAPAPDIPQFGSGRQPPRTALGRLANAATWRVGSRLMRGLTDAYAERRAANGLPPLPAGVTAFDHMLSDQLHLQASTPLLEFPRRHWPPSVRLVGPLLPPAPAPGSVALPPWWPQLRQARAVVHVTQGSVATDPELLTRPALEGLADLDALVVVTTPEPDRLGPVPANARVSGFLPHGLLLPEVHVVVTNAGYNGVKAALGAGVPVVMAPWGNDQPDVAARVTRVGAGIDMRRRTPSPRQIAEAVRRALTDPELRTAAGRIRAEFATYQGGDAAAAALTELVRPGDPAARH